MSPRACMPSKQFLASQLFDAVEERNMHEIFTLLDRDSADPNFIIPDKGISSFHLVIGSDCLYFAEEVTRAFLQRSGNPNIRSEDGLTPVHVAAVWGRTKLLVLLLSCGGNPWLRDSEFGFTPLHFALKEKHWETALILQHYQLTDRRKRAIDTTNDIPRFKKNLETVVVNAGEMQAEYATSLQDNCSPIQVPKDAAHKLRWNIDPLETHEYVRQWCRKEFTPHPVTSTPTHHKTLNLNAAPCQQNVPSVFAGSSPNITSSKQLPPKVVEYGTNFALPTNSKNSRHLGQPATDVRKNLFLELKRRFNGFKQSFDLSREDSSKGNLFERSSGYFGRRSFRKSKKKADCSDKSEVRDSLSDLNEDISRASGYLSFKTPVELEGEGNSVDSHIECAVQSSLENAPVDEVDAVHLNNSVDASVEWIASQSCFTEERSPDSSNSQSYFTCDEGPTLDVNNYVSISKSISNTVTSKEIIVLGQPEPAPQRPPRRKVLRELNRSVAETIPSSAPSTASLASIVSEKYRYTDNDAGVVLIESHLLTKPIDVPSPCDSESIVSVPHTVSDTPTGTSDVSSLPASFHYDTAALREALVSLGEAVGPITATTKKVYLRKLYNLKRESGIPLSVPTAPCYSPELQKVLKNKKWEIDILTYAKYERLMCAPFENPDPNRRWREGVAKSSFNYLLLDPRLSNNLPASVAVHDLNAWRQFLSAIFYVGKGKRSRPYAHLYQAVHSWNKGEKFQNSNVKIQRILDIWRQGGGVVCLQIFQNIIPVEAFTREAAMIDALGTNNLVNLKCGEYYGPASTWQSRQKKQLGVYLLYRAMRIFLCEGERQLRPGDID